MNVQHDDERNEAPPDVVGWVVSFFVMGFVVYLVWTLVK